MALPYQAYGNYWIVKPFIYISPYFVMSVLAITAAFVLAYYEFRRRKLETRHLIWMSVIAYLAGGAIARLFYFFGPWSSKGFPTAHDKILGLFGFEPGMVFYGGLIGSIIAIMIYARIRRLDFWKHMDAWAPSLGIFLFFARIGCFFSGCCYGKTSSIGLPWLIQTKEAIIHPTQIYSSAFGLVLFIALTELRHRQTSRRLFSGYVTLWGLALYGIWRFFVEFLRDYSFSIGWLSPSQCISLIIVIVSAVILIKGDDKRKL